MELSLLGSRESFAACTAVHMFESYRKKEMEEVKGAEKVRNISEIGFNVSGESLMMKER